MMEVQTKIGPILPICIWIYGTMQNLMETQTQTLTLQTQTLTLQTQTQTLTLQTQTLTLTLQTQTLTLTQTVE